jgi:hypothetical protein
LQNAFALFSVLAVASSTLAQNDEGSATMVVMKSTRHAVSAAVRELPQISEFDGGTDVHEPLPLPPFRNMARNNQIRIVDSALQAGPLQILDIPGLLLNFDGISVGDGTGRFAAPPDTNGAVGLTQYVQSVNLAFAIYDKATGALISGPTPTNALWTGFGGDCESRNDGDPVVLYDRAADRWVISQFALGPYFTGTGSFLQCVAVSTSGDATGSYNLYAFDFGIDDFIDYGKLGSWPTGYFASFNTFNRTGSFFKYGKECAFDRTAMVNGSPVAGAVCFNTPSDAGFLPSDFDGSIPPPVGAADPFLEIWNVGPSSSLAIWSFQVDYDTPSNSSFGPPVVLAVAPFSLPPHTPIPQARTSQQLDSLGDRMMFRLDYRNFGDHESLVANHSVGNTSQVSVRWYEIRDPNGTPVVYQQGTYAPDGGFRWMGSIAMDQVGNIAMAYSVSDSLSQPSIQFTGRQNTDPLGTMESETLIFAGPGVQLPFLSRWGDYSDITVDPVDDCTFWFTSEYIPFDGRFNWKTRIANFKFANCPAGP